MFDKLVKNHEDARMLAEEFSKTRMDVFRVIQLLKLVYPPSSQEILPDVKRHLSSYGTLDLFNSPRAQLQVTEKGICLSNPVFDLLFDEEGKARFTGSCEQIQPMLFAYLSAKYPDQEKYFPIKEWIDFVVGGRVDFNHFFMGTETSGNSGFKRSAIHDLDSSQFFTRLFHCRGSIDNGHKVTVAGLTDYGSCVISGELDLGAGVPLYETVDKDGVRLFSIRVFHESDKTTVHLIMNVLKKDDLDAPSLAIETSFDLSQPEVLLEGAIEEFVRCEGFVKGCVYNLRKINLIDELPKNETEKYRAAQKVVVQTLGRFQLGK